MIEYRLQQIEPVSVRVPGCRAQSVEWVVMLGSNVVAVFVDERRADNYARRLNAWRRQATGGNRKEDYKPSAADARARAQAEAYLDEGYRSPFDRPLYRGRNR